MLTNIYPLSFSNSNIGLDNKAPCVRSDSIYLAIQAEDDQRTSS